MKHRQSSPRRRPQQSLQRKGRGGKALRDMYPLIKMLAKAKESDRAELIGNAQCCPARLCRALTEVTANVLRGAVPLSERQFRELSGKVTDMERLVAAKSIPAKRRILQKGGFLGALLSPVMRFIGPAVAGLLKPIVKPIAESILSSR